MDDVKNNKDELVLFKF